MTGEGRDQAFALAAFLVLVVFVVGLLVMVFFAGVLAVEDFFKDALRAAAEFGHEYSSEMNR